MRDETTPEDRYLVPAVKQAMEAAAGKRVIVAKVGLDEHGNDVRIFSKWLVDGGYEMV